VQLVYRTKFKLSSLELLLISIRGSLSKKLVPERVSCGPDNKSREVSQVVFTDVAINY